MTKLPGNDPFASKKARQAGLDIARANDEAEKRAPKTEQKEGEPDLIHFELRKNPNKRWDWILWDPGQFALGANPKSYARRNDATRAVNRMREELGQSRIVVASAATTKPSTVGPTHNIPGDAVDPIPRSLHFEIRKNPFGPDWNWVLWSANHRAIAVNPKGFATKGDAEVSVRRMREEARRAAVLVATM